MKHRHHLKPRHRGGTDDDGIVEVSLTCHAMFHYCEWQRLGLDADRLAYLFLSNKTEEAERLRVEMVRKANTGRKITGSHRENMSKSLTGKKRTPEQRERLRQNGLKGTQHLRTTFLATSPDGITTEHTGIKSFCREHNLPKSSVHRCLHGQAKSVHGWTFKTK